MFGLTSFSGFFSQLFSRGGWSRHLNLHLLASANTEDNSNEDCDAEEHCKDDGGCLWVSFLPQLEVGSHVFNIVVVNDLCYSPVSSDVQVTLGHQFSIGVSTDSGIAIDNTIRLIEILLRVRGLVSNVGIKVLLGDGQDAFEDVEKHTDVAWWGRQGTSVDPSVGRLHDTLQLSVRNAG